MKNVVKLTQGQLRSIVNEVSNASRYHASMKHSPEVVLNGAIENVGRFWKDTFNEGDPVQAEYGQAEWDRQVDAAVQDLYDRFMSALNEVDERLLNGEYYR